MKQFFCLLAILCMYVYGFAQNNKSPSQSNFISPMNIGNVVPDINVGNILNYTKSTINLKDYKGKTVIIHFLLSTCSPCLTATKKYDSLTKMSGGKLQFIIVTREPVDKVKKFIAKMPDAFGKTPVVAADTKLEKLFPYEWISHVVWINPKGRVAAITDAQYVNSNNIGLVASCNLPTWPIKRDISSFNKNSPLIRINSDNIPFASNPSSMGYSMLFSNMASIQVNVYNAKDSALQLQRFTYVNHSIPELYMRAFKLPQFPKTHIIIKSPESNHFYYNSSQYFRAGWEEHNTYSYECVLPFNMGPLEVEKKMITDLDFNLGTRGYIKDTVVDGYILKLASSIGLSMENNHPKEKDWMSISSLLYHLNEKYMGKPVQNMLEGIDKKYLPINLALLDDFPALMEKLAIYGLELQPANISIKALVIEQIHDFRFKHSPKLYKK